MIQLINGFETAGGIGYQEMPFIQLHSAYLQHEKFNFI